MKLRKGIKHDARLIVNFVAFTPKGGCPLKLRKGIKHDARLIVNFVAFTPKGGC